MVSIEVLSLWEDLDFNGRDTLKIRLQITQDGLLDTYQHCDISIAVFYDRERLLRLVKLLSPELKKRRTSDFRIGSLNSSQIDRVREFRNSAAMDSLAGWPLNRTVVDGQVVIRDCTGDLMVTFPVLQSAEIVITEGPQGTQSAVEHTADFTARVREYMDGLSSKEDHRKSYDARILGE